MGKSKYYYPIEEFRLNAKTDKFNLKFLQT